MAGEGGEIMCNGAICGGVISMTKMRRDMKKYGAYANMMSFVMPDNEPLTADRAPILMETGFQVQLSYKV